MLLQPERVGRYIWRHFPAADSFSPLPTLGSRLDICRPLNCNRRRKELSPICTRNDYSYQIISDQQIHPRAKLKRNFTAAGCSDSEKEHFQNHGVAIT